MTHSPHPTQVSSLTRTIPVVGSLVIALGFTGHARMQAGLSHCWHDKARKSKGADRSESCCCSSPANHTTLLRRSPGPRPFSVLHAASQLLHPVQRSRSIIKASRVMIPTLLYATNRCDDLRQHTPQKILWLRCVL